MYRKNINDQTTHPRLSTNPCYWIFDQKTPRWVYKKKPAGLKTGHDVPSLSHIFVKYLMILAELDFF